MPISNKYKCLFIHIPKTGGTSIETAFEMFGDWKVENKDTLFGLMQSPELKALNLISNFLQHVTLDQAQLISPIPSSYTTFSFVRNPWDKMVSIYSNPDNNLASTAMQQGIKLKNLSFEDFITQIEKIKHIHLEPQHKFICDDTGKINVSFLGKFESLEKDFKNLCKIIDKDIRLPHKNRSARGDYRDYYSNKSRKIIEERYQRDINLFSYSF